MSPRFTLTTADNGWIVRVHQYPPEGAKDPAMPEVGPRPTLIVFNDWDMLIRWQHKFFRGAV